MTSRPTPAAKQSFRQVAAGEVPAPAWLPDGYEPGGYGAVAVRGAEETVVSPVLAMTVLVRTKPPCRACLHMVRRPPPLQSPREHVSEREPPWTERSCTQNLVQVELSSSP
ncbi:hypothetical protein [Streptomyces sp. NBC_00557]|uniref:hypothetical protein n=1 Tax=Streptomyces sp. NBC_00557 TaxID=2975776 RepID=UPI002E81175D|nr:hypothetical protein [Streptomyces sp. NBC_00557]WUC39311.1 hypothetical protein OG956_36340 [Streptomyces sp. NBC_00557]